MDKTAYVSSVIWESCIDERIRIELPWPFDDVEERIRACVRLIREKGTFYVEVDAFGGRWRYSVASQCVTVYEWGVARLRLCIEPVKQGGSIEGVKVTLQGCLGITSPVNISQCWTLLAERIDIALLDESRADDVATARRNVGKTPALPEGRYGVVVTPLGDADVATVTSR
ncbi:MAG: hypothetical protein RKE49_15930 [Oceanicaulis sp.]